MENKNKTDQAASTFGLISDPTRLRLLTILSANKKRQLCVTDIAKMAGITLSAASHQLRKLEYLGIVAKCRYGQEICYCVNADSALARKILRMIRLAYNEV